MTLSLRWSQGVWVHSGRVLRTTESLGDGSVSTHRGAETEAVVLEKPAPRSTDSHLRLFTGPSVASSPGSPRRAGDGECRNTRGAPRRFRTHRHSGYVCCSNPVERVPPPRPTQVTQPRCLGTGPVSPPGKVAGPRDPVSHPCAGTVRAARVVHCRHEAFARPAPQTLR